MTNHPGRPKPGSAQPLRMTPDQLRDLLARSAITQQQAADLAGVKLPTMKQYLSGLRPMPESAAGLLCLSLAVLGAPVGLMAPWVQPGVVQALETRWAKRRTREAMQAAATPSPALMKKAALLADRRKRWAAVLARHEAGETLAQIAADLGLSVARVRQMKESALVVQRRIAAGLDAPPPSEG